MAEQIKNPHKHASFNRLLRSLYDRDRDAFDSNSLKGEFDKAVEQVSYDQAIIDRDLRDMEGSIDPKLLTKFVQDVGSEMDLDPTAVAAEVAAIGVDETHELKKEMKDVGYFDIEEYQNEWFTRGFEEMYYTPFDYKQEARTKAMEDREYAEAMQDREDRANGITINDGPMGYVSHKIGDVDVSPDLDQVLAHREYEASVQEMKDMEDREYAEAMQDREDRANGITINDGPMGYVSSKIGDVDFTELDVSVESNIDDVLHNVGDLTDENYDEIINQAYMNSPRSAEFATFLQDMQVSDIDKLKDSPLFGDFKQAVEDYTIKTETMDITLRDSNGYIEDEAFGEFLKDVGDELALPPILVSDSIGYMMNIEDDRTKTSARRYDWFTENYQELYGTSFDAAMSVAMLDEINYAEAMDPLNDATLGSFGEPVDVAWHKPSHNSSESSYDKMVSLLSDIKDGRTPSDSALKDTFGTSSSSVMADWDLTQESLVDSDGLFRDYMSRSIIVTSENAPNQENVIDLPHSFAVVNRTFGPDITPDAIADFTAGYEAVYHSPIDALTKKSIAEQEIPIDAEALMVEAETVFAKQTRIEIEDDGPEF